jgi:hypothetical protein
MRYRVFFIFAIFLLTFGVAVAIGLSQDYHIPRDVIGNGGQWTSSGDYAADATLGQAVIGHALSEDYGLCHGFWCNLATPTPTPTPTQTPGPGVPVGAATLMYIWNFDEIGAVSGTLLLLTLFAARWMYDGALPLWKVS